MIEFCVTFFNDEDGKEPEETFHCHITMPTEASMQEVIEQTCTNMVKANATFGNATGVSVRAVMNIDQPLRDSFELLRSLHHPGQPTQVQDLHPHGHGTGQLH